MKDKLDAVKKEDTDSAADAKKSAEKDDGKSGGVISFLFELVPSIAGPMLLVVLLLTFVFRLVNVDGTSMMDTLHDSDKMIVTNFLYEPQDGDIVVISHGVQYATPLVKRVIATEGQTVKIDYVKNQLTVDGVVIDEPYVKETMANLPAIYDLDIPEVIPEGKVFVMGDNRNHSLDSRSQKIGLINKTDIIGKAQFIVLPFNRFGYLY